jgi:exonuclease VII large subunit
MDDNNLELTTPDINWHQPMAHIDKFTGNPKHTQESLLSKQRITTPAIQQKTTQGTPKQDMNYSDKAKEQQQERQQHWTEHIWANQKTAHQQQNPQVSHISNEKWHTQVYNLFSQNGCHNMDAYLAIPQMAMKWIVTPEKILLSLHCITVCIMGW